jgi:ATP/maltotriose-dependent transcriptional regulator MalT
MRLYPWVRPAADETEQAEEVPDRHRTEAAWLADHGDVVDAIRHTLAVGDWPDVAALLFSHHLFILTLDGQDAVSRRGCGLSLPGH